MPRNVYIPRFTGRPYGGGGFAERRVWKRLRGMVRAGELKRQQLDDLALDPTDADFLGSALPTIFTNNSVGGAVTFPNVVGGVANFSTGAVANNTAHIAINVAQLDRTLNPRVEIRVKLSQTANQIARLGFTDNVNNYIYFRHASATSANWYGVTASGGTETALDLGVASGTGWAEMQFDVDDDEGVVIFQIADADLTMIERGAITTNIPTAGLRPAYMYIETTAAEDKVMQVDYFKPFFRRAPI